MSIYDKSSLVLIPSGTKTGKVFSQKPTNGDGDFTFTRSSAATRVNADGNIEKETQNLLLQNNSFDTGWGLSNVTMTSGQSGYDGSNDAWLMTDINSGAYGTINQSVTTGGITTFSCYAKSGTTDIFGLRPIGGSSPYVFFDLSNGTFEGAGDTANLIDYDIQDVGSGWYRCSVTTSATATQVFIYIATTGGALAPSGSTIYIQDAQLNQGLIAQEVITTTTSAVYGGITDNVPRLDYTDSSCPALLLEPLRTNVMGNSEYFNGTPYVVNNSAISANQAISPEGLQNAYNFVPDITGTPLHRIYDNQSASIQTATHSIFIKPNGHNYYALRESATTGASIGFDFTDNSIITEYSTGGCTASNGKIENYGNGWYRISGTFTFATSTNNGFGLYAAAPNWTSGDVQGVSWAGNGVNGAYIYGAQVEAGAYATSYIPTYGSSVSRIKEICEVTSAEDLIGQTEGTIAGEFNYNSGEPTNRLFSITGSDWNSDGSIRFDIISLKPQATIRSNGGEPAKIIGTQDINVGSLVKFAVVYTSTTLKMFVNGAQIGSTATLTGSLPSTLDEIRINALGGNFVSDTQNNQLNPYKQALVFKTALTDQEAIDLTTI